MNKREQQKEQTVTEILEVSEKLFHEKGYEKTSIQNIADKCSLSKGALYHHFRSKEEVLEKICLNQYLLMKETFMPIAEKSGMSMMEKIKEIMTIARGQAMNTAAVTFSADIPENHISTENAAMEKLFDYYSRKIYIEVFAPVLEQGKTEGDCSFPCSAENMALFIHQLDSGMTNRLRNIISESGKNAHSELRDLINGFNYTVSKLIAMPVEKVEKMTLSDKMLELYQSIIENRKNSYRDKNPGK